MKRFFVGFTAVALTLLIAPWVLLGLVYLIKPLVPYFNWVMALANT